MKNSKIIDIIDILSQIECDDTIPKNMRLKVKDMMTSLENSKESIIVDKAIQELDNIAEDPGLPVYAKTQIWNAVSLLESRQ
ncbi:MAG: UPF0147 family protein [Candidatus Nanoarchaeia archaeon]|nr:UPF0147 family protein [Candidatus Nanoarchaeia archaeon]